MAIVGCAKERGTRDVRTRRSAALCTPYGNTVMPL
jgi:hypothetical protein